MNANTFREEELVSRRVKVGNEWQTRTFPVVGGRLRILHETNDHLGIQTEIIRLEPDFVVVQAAAETTKGKFNGIGTASTQRDARLADSLVELAETRAVARALRFAGFGLEFCGAEEIAHITEGDPEAQRTADKQAAPAFPEDNGNGKGEAKAPNGTPAETGSKPKSGGFGQATQAQCRALFALTRKAKMGDEDIARMLTPFSVTRFEDLLLPDASRLIQSLQTEAAA
jgi:hypothetical protein